MDIKTICYFGIYKADYGRNRVLLRGLKENGIKILECNSHLFGVRKYLDLIRKHWKIRGDYDLMLVAFPGYQAVILAKLLTGKPIIFDSFFSIYNAAVEDRKTSSAFSFRGIYCWLLDWFSCALADKILLDANANIDYFVKNFGINRDKFIRVFVGTDPNIFYPRETKKDNKFLVHFHGHFIPLQGAGYIIKAANILRNEEIQFQIIGKGQEYGTIREIAKDLDLKNIIWIDSVPYEDLPKYISRADVCLGGFGDTEKSKIVSMNKLFEYMACGKPIITGDSLAVRELLVENETAVFCERANAEDLARKILILKNDSILREKLGRNVRIEFENKYTPKIIVSKLLEKINE